MHRRNYQISLILLLLSCCVSHALQGETLRKGILDLRAWDPLKDPVVAIQGEAEFYWEQWIASEGIESEAEFLPVPGTWNLDGSHPGQGYGSYRFHVILNAPQPLRLSFGPFYSNVRIWVDGKLLQVIGIPGKSPDTSMGQLQGAWDASFTPHHAEFDIVLEISNFDIFLAGVLATPMIGTYEGVGRYQRGLVALGFFLIGTVIIMGVYHIGLFGLRRSDPSTLYYALLCFGLAFYMLSGDPSDAWNVMTSLGFEARILTYNYSWILAIVGFILYHQSLYPEDVSKKFSYFIAFVSLTYLAIIAPLKVRVYVDSTQTFQLVVAVAIIYVLYTMAVAWRNRRDGARIFLLSVVFLFACVIHDMLVTRGLFSHVPIGGIGVFCFTFCQSYILSSRFSHAYFRAEISENEVRKLNIELSRRHEEVLKLNTTLEARVEEQTREIRSIMEHIKLGIFVIHGPRKLIHRDYSLHLEKILEQTNLEGQEALPLLFSSSNLGADAVDQIFNVMSVTLGEPLFSFDMNESALPRSIVKQGLKGDSRSLDLDWNPILGEDARIDKILVTVNDVTAMKELEKSAHDAAEELGMIVEILNVSDVEFRRFLKMSKEFVCQNRNLIEKADSETKDPEVVKIIFMNLHTIKGAARTLHFRELSDLIHLMEQSYAQLSQSDFGTWDLEQISRDMMKLELRIADYEQLATAKLGRHSSDEARVIMSSPEAFSSFTGLRDLLAATDLSHVQKVDPLYRALLKTLFVPLPDLVSDIFAKVSALAKDLNKPMPELVLTSLPLLVSTRTDEVLRSVFFHLLRNAMDHGIESESIRLARNKSGRGCITLLVTEVGEEIVLSLSDDGKGLLLHRLAALGRARGLIKEEEQDSRQAIANLIFAPGISTAPTVTQISGRGVGMSAVARFIYDIGGRISIQLLREQEDEFGCVPFSIIIRLPHSLFYPLPNLPSATGVA